MRRIAATLFLCLFAAVITASSQSPGDLALAKLAVTAHSTGNLLLEQILLRRIMIESSGDLADAGRHRLAENALAQGDYAETIRLLNSSDGAAAKVFPEQDRHDRIVLARAYARLGETDQARQIAEGCLGTVLDMPSGYSHDEPDDADLDAAKLLDALGGDIDEIEHFSRADVYQFNRYWNEAREHYKFVKTKPDAAVEALFQIGRGYTQSGEYENAIPYYQSVIDNYAETPQAKDALLQMAGAYSRVDSTDHAISLYQSFIAKYNADDKLDRAYLNIVDIYRDLGDDAHALEWCQKTEAAFPNKTPEALAIFDEAKIHASRSEWQNEIAALDRLKGRNDLGGASQPGGATVEEIAFMRGYALEQLGRRDEAIVGYLSIPDGLGAYYGNMATARLENMGSTRPARPVNALYDHISFPTDPSLSLEEGKLANARLVAAEQAARNGPPYKEDGYLFHPSPYADTIRRDASAVDVDPRLVLAIMRTESKFDPQARSNAAARGLMQFTHPQAVKIAKELGWTYFDDDELYSPENSIALAAKYLADLSQMFGERTSSPLGASSQTEAVVASYNGGEDNVKRWMARARSNEPERYVPELVFGQTKDYVAKVMANYRVYQQLYDEQLRPK